MKKIYYQLKFKQTSPLRISNGDNDYSDNDLLLDGRGFPFIPGSSIAGILRSMLREQDAEEIFGIIKPGKNKSDPIITESHVLVSDAVLNANTKEADFTVTIRDGVGLDEWGVSDTQNNSKYDFQTVETDCEYTGIVEWNGENAKEITDVIDPLMKSIVTNGISAGARTTRGYGAFNVKIKKKVFDFPKDITKWLDFDPFKENAFDDVQDMDKVMESQDKMRIEIGLKIAGSFTVRIKKANYVEMEDGTIPDAAPLMNFHDKPVIPGTAWAGSFLHHMQDLIRECSGVEQNREIENLNLIFGKSKDKGKYIKSQIAFGETEINGGTMQVVMRNAVDRFTGAPKNTGLFTSAVWQNGAGILHIELQKDSMTVFQRRLLAISLIDLELGLLTFGGEASIGRGRAEITSLSVNGEDVLVALKEMRTDFLEEAE